MVNSFGRNVSHTFYTNTGVLPVLENLTLSVPQNGFTAIVGPSGCGKSTVTRLIAGLLKPDSGSIWLQGQRVLSPRNVVGMAFQNPVLLEWRNILKNVVLPLEIVPNSISPANREERARALLKLVGLLRKSLGQQYHPIFQTSKVPDCPCLLGFTKSIFSTAGALVVVTV